MREFFVLLGENCDVQLIAPRIQEHDPQKGSSTYIFGMILIIMIVCGFFGFLFYHRRKVATLKSVIAHVGVTYINEGSTIDGKITPVWWGRGRCVR